MEEQVILVDENDNAIGVREKIKTHLEGTLHRAFSIFIFNSEGHLLLQKRAGIKYHSGGLWSNTCCSHPRPEESIKKAAHRRLKEEMGFDCELKEVFSFIYKVSIDEVSVEHEYDHILIGEFNDEPMPNIEEVADWKWVQVEKLRIDIERNPESYTAWLVLSISKVLDNYFNSKNVGST